jgi:hypothetical protein
MDCSDQELGFSLSGDGQFLERVGGHGRVYDDEEVKTFTVLPNDCRIASAS